MANQVAIIAGVGPGTGASLARKFAKKYPVVLLARNPDNYNPVIAEIEKAGGKATGVSTDVSSPESVNAALEKVKEFAGKDGVISAAVFNVGGRFIRKPFLELSLDEFESGFEANGRGAFLFSQTFLPLLLKGVQDKYPEGTYPPTLIFTGATAAIKGSAQCTAFSTGKFALRSLSQSLAREFGPQGVHVVHATIDGVIDIDRTKGWKFDAPDAKISSEAIADSYWYLHTQPRTAFTHEIDIRPYVEKW